jgi:hypothetical protein
MQRINILLILKKPIEISQEESRSILLSAPQSSKQNGNNKTPSLTPKSLNL